MTTPNEFQGTEMTFEEWRTVMSISLDGSFHCIKACLPSMCGPGAGFITGQTIHVNGGMLMAN